MEFKCGSELARDRAGRLDIDCQAVIASKLAPTVALYRLSVVNALAPAARAGP